MSRKNVQLQSIIRKVSSLIKESISRPALGVSPLPVALVELVNLPSCLRRVAQVHRLHLLRLDDDHTEVSPRNRVFQVFHLLPNSEVLIVVRLVHGLSRWRVLESACIFLSVPYSQNHKQSKIKTYLSTPASYSQSAPSTPSSSSTPPPSQH
jgi:hypothetical protein